MSPEDRSILEKLLILAEGDLGRVERAVRQSERSGHGADLGQIVDLLKVQRRQTQVAKQQSA